MVALLDKTQRRGGLPAGQQPAMGWRNHQFRYELEHRSQSRKARKGALLCDFAVRSLPVHELMLALPNRNACPARKPLRLCGYSLMEELFNVRQRP